MGPHDDAAITVDVSLGVTEISLRVRGELVYSQSIRVGAATEDRFALLEAVLVAQHRAPHEVAAGLAKGGILLRSIVPLDGFDALLRERTGLRVTIGR